MPDGLLQRVDDLTRRVGTLEDSKPDVIATKVEGLTAELREVKEDVKSLRRSFYALATSIAGSAMIFALTIFAVFK